MPNVDAGPAGSPSPEQMIVIAEVEDGVFIDGRRSYSLDQQRYDGQFGWDALWEIRNGRWGYAPDVTVG